VWECRKSQDEESSTADICMYHRKPPAVYRVRKPVGYRITFKEDDHALMTSYLNPDSIPDFVERMSNNSRILDSLKHECLTEVEIAKNLNMPVGTVHVTLYRLSQKGFVTVTGKQGKCNVWGKGTTVTE
jgi:hypothetical protein